MGAATLWCRSSGADVKFRGTPGEARETPFESTAEPQTDIPTPQLFRIVIDKQNGVLVLEDPLVQKIMIPPLPRPNLISPTQAPPQQSRNPNPSRPPSHSLTGVETLLLRDAETLAEKSKR